MKRAGNSANTNQSFLFLPTDEIQTRQKGGENLPKTKEKHKDIEKRGYTWICEKSDDTDLYGGKNIGKPCGALNGYWGIGYAYDGRVNKWQPTCNNIVPDGKGGLKKCGRKKNLVVGKNTVQEAHDFFRCRKKMKRVVEEARYQMKQRLREEEDAKRLLEEEANEVWKNHGWKPAENKQEEE